jgi:hypothetical protein
LQAGFPRDRLQLFTSYTDKGNLHDSFPAWFSEQARQVFARAFLGKPIGFFRLFSPGMVV